MKKIRGARRAFQQLVSENFSDVVVETDGDQSLLKYEVDGEFDYELYKETQTLGNKMKLGNQWAPEDHIRILSEYMGQAGNTPKRGICHGTRQGNEQVWFRRHIPGDADVIGTEISDTATEFPHTIQWDFHDQNDAWIGQMDFVYSNSWDHAFDPKKALKNWAECLIPGGVLLLDHGWNYEVDRVTALDPFGISEKGLVDMLNEECAQYGKVEGVIDGGKHKNLPIRTVIFRAHA